MVCDYFSEASGPVCLARSDRGLVIPTITEETRYCLTNRFRECVHWQEKMEAVEEANGRRGQGEARAGGSSSAAGV